jgi:hypothetical protein
MSEGSLKRDRTQDEEIEVPATPQSEAIKRTKASEFDDDDEDEDEIDEDDDDEDEDYEEDEIEDVIDAVAADEDRPTARRRLIFV